MNQYSEVLKESEIQAEKEMKNFIRPIKRK